MQSPHSAVYIKMPSNVDSCDKKSFLSAAIDWATMYGIMDLLMEKYATSSKRILGTLIHILMISMSVCSGAVYGYWLFPRMFEPTSNSSDLKNDSQSYKNWYLITSTLVSFAVMGLQEFISYLLQTKIEKRLTNIENDVTTLKNDVTTLKNDVTTLKDDVTTLKDDVTTLKDDVKKNFEILFKHLNLVTPIVEIPDAGWMKKSAIPIKAEIDTVHEYNKFYDSINHQESNLRKRTQQK